MHDLYNLKEMLVKELEEFGHKGDLTKPSLDIVDKVAHATKNVIKVIEYCEQDKVSKAVSVTDTSVEERVREELRRMAETL